MKKLLLVAVLFTAAIGTTSAQSISIGAKAGVNFSSLNGDDVSDLDGRTNIHGGGVINIGINELLAVQPEVIFSSQGFTDEQGGLSVTGKLDYINIPVLADFTLAEGFSLQGGPQMGINITDEVEIGGQTSPLGSESIDLSAVIGAQYRLPIGLFFQARYAIGLSNVYSEITIEGVSIESDAKNSVFSLSAGFFFN